MVHNTKKRSVSESEPGKKVKEEFVSKKKKSANGTAQNGQANKEVKKEVLPQVKVEQKPGAENKNKERRVAYREKRKQLRARKGAMPDISVEDIKKKVEEIENRGDLSKSAKRKLASLKKLLHVKEGTYKPKPQPVKKQAKEGKKEKQVAAANKKQVQNTVEQKKKVPGKVEAKTPKDSKKKDVKQGSLLLVKQKKQPDDDDDDDDDEEEDSDVEAVSGEDEDGSDVEEEEDDDDDEDEEDEDEEDDDEEDEDEDEEEEDDEEEVTEEVKTKGAQSGPKQTAEQGGKKKRYVLFVGNLPFNITPEEIKKHFLTKVSQIVDIRLPKTKDNAPRGFAYVELGNHTDYEKAISLNNSFVNGRRINVQYSGSNKKETVAKNQKLQALQKAGKLGGGQQKTNFRKNAGWKGGKPNPQKTKT